MNKHNVKAVGWQPEGKLSGGLNSMFSFCIWKFKFKLLLKILFNKVHGIVGNLILPFGMMFLCGYFVSFVL